MFPGLSLFQVKQKKKKKSLSSIISEVLMHSSLNGILFSVCLFLFVWLGFFFVAVFNFTELMLFGKMNLS